jgi:menaquinone-9 beta-reductase
MSSDVKETDMEVDVIVVGARIAGSALATHLGNQGRSVALIDRATFPSGTLSTHIIQVSGVRSLQRLGLLDDLRSTGAPFLTTLRPLYDGIDLTAEIGVPEDWPPGALSIDREQMDHFLVAAAERAGVVVHLGTKVTSVLRATDGRVSGVRIRTPSGEERSLRARLVVGADGRASTVASLVGSRTYNVVPNQRFVYWGDYHGVDLGASSSLFHYRNGTDLVIACASDRGRFTVMVSPGLGGYAAFRKNPTASYEAAVRGCELLRPHMARAELTGRIVGTAFFPGYFRESSGPGWALIGDAGQFKDPAAGQGISDALRQAEVLADRLRGADFDTPAHVDTVTESWWRWRDRDAFAMYWLAADLAASGDLDPLVRSALRVIATEPKSRQAFVDGVISHRVNPYQVLTPRLIAKAAVRLVRDEGLGVAEVARLLGRRGATEARRAALHLRPRYADLPRGHGHRPGPRPDRAAELDIVTPTGDTP